MCEAEVSPAPVCGNHILELNSATCCRTGNDYHSLLMLISIDTTDTAYNVKMIFATSVPLGWATYLGTDTSHYSQCGPVFGKSLFFFHTFYSKSTIWHAEWSCWLDCQWTGCDPIKQQFVGAVDTVMHSNWSCMLVGIFYACVDLRWRAHFLNKCKAYSNCMSMPDHSLISNRCLCACRLIFFTIWLITPPLSSAGLLEWSHQPTLVSF